MLASDWTVRGQWGCTALQTWAGNQTEAAQQERTECSELLSLSADRMLTIQWMCPGHMSVGEPAVDWRVKAQLLDTTDDTEEFCQQMMPW